MNYRNRALLNLAKDAPCMNCGAQNGTTVAAHSNSLRHGKGRGIKAHDSYIAFLCFECHRLMDANEPCILSSFEDLMGKTYLYLWQSGLIKVA